MLDEKKIAEKIKELSRRKHGTVEYARMQLDHENWHQLKSTAEELEAIELEVKSTLEIIRLSKLLEAK